MGWSDFFKEGEIERVSTNPKVNVDEAIKGLQESRDRGGELTLAQRIQLAGGSKGLKAADEARQQQEELQSRDISKTTGVSAPTPTVPGFELDAKETPEGADTERQQAALKKIEGSGYAEQAALRSSMKEMAAFSGKGAFDTATKLLEQDDQDLIHFAGQYKTLPNFESKMKAVKDEYDSRVMEMGKQRALSSMFSLIGHIAVGLYGAEHGVDTSGVKFDTVDWAAQYNQILDNYKISSDIRKSEYEAGMSRREKLLKMVEGQVASQKEDVYKKGQLAIAAARGIGEGQREAGKLEYTSEENRAKEAAAYKKSMDIKDAEIQSEIFRQGRTEEWKTKEREFSEQFKLQAADIQRTYNDARTLRNQEFVKQQTKAQQEFEAGLASQKGLSQADRDKAKREFLAEQAKSKQQHDAEMLNMKIAAQEHLAAYKNTFAEQKVAVAQGFALAKEGRVREQKQADDVFKTVQDAANDKAEVQASRYSGLAGTVPGLPTFPEWLKTKGTFAKINPFTPSMSKQYVEEMQPAVQAFIKGKRESVGGTAGQGSTSSRQQEEQYAKIKMKTPSGQIFNIPKEKKDEFLKDNPNSTQIN